MVPQVVTDPKDPLARLERRVALERKVQWVPLEEMVFKVLWACLVQLVLKVPPEKTATRVKSAGLDRREAKETRVNQVPQVPVVFRVWSELLVQLAATVRLDPGDSRGCLDRKVTKDQEGSRDSQDQSDCRDCRDLLVRRERMGM